MTEEFLTQLRTLDFDSLTAKEAAGLRLALTLAVLKADEWFAALSQDFGQGAKPAKAEGNGRPPGPITTASPPTPPVKAPKRRGRPVPNLQVDLKVNKRPAPLAIGGADAATEGPRPATIFQESYVSKDGPKPGAALPADHPRSHARPSSVTADVDMSDFAEVEQAMRKGELGKMFQ